MFQRLFEENTEALLLRFFLLLPLPFLLLFLLLLLVFVILCLILFVNDSVFIDFVPSP